ncbi:unnamed protein product [marine sediment metagenome]|uniref:Translation initiation factor IF-3 n=1 Tax=marine sediment metagenome TaxID=412755 RepID=X1C0M8_9ZZZZ
MYEMKPVTDKQIKTSRSIFDPLLDEFLKSGQELVEVAVDGRSSGYMNTQLRKRIEKRQLDIEVSPGYDVIYLEKKPKTL